MREPARRALALVVVAGATLLASCTDAGWDGGATEREIHASLVAAHPGSEVDVRCADRVASGDRCDVSVGDLQVQVVLVEAEEGAVAYRFVQDVLATADVAGVLAEQLEAETGDQPVLVCEPGPLVLPRAGDELRCTATADGRRHEVTAVFVDDQGTVRVSAIRPDAPS